MAVLKRKTLGRFARSDDGSATIESLLWIPFFVFLLLFIADVTLIFMNQSMALRVTQDGVRSLAVYEIADCAALQTWLETTLNGMANSATATCAISGDYATTTVTMNSSDLDLTGATGWIANFPVQVSAQHFMERP